MTQNILQLNGDWKDRNDARRNKTKLSLISVKTLQIKIPQSHSLTVKTLGILIDSTLSVENFISFVGKSLFTEAAVKLVTSLILSRLDYCSSLLSGLRVLLASHFKNLKRTTSLPCFSLSTGSQSQKNIKYRINTLCYKCITRTAPSYLCDRLQLYTPSRTLRSASDTLSLQIHRTRLLHCWCPNLFCLRYDMTLYMECLSLDSFKSNLFIFFFLSETIDLPRFQLSVGVFLCLKPLYVVVH